MGSISEPEVTLFVIRFSTFAQRVRISLEEKGISCKIIDVDPFVGKPQLLLESNPIYKGKVPTIIHNGNPLAESLVILEYLEEEWPQRAPLMPSKALERANARFWTDYIYKTFDKLSATYRSKPGSPEQQAAREDATNSLKTLETAIINYSAEGPFFAGERFGYLDVVLAPLENTLLLAEKLGGLVVPEIPRIHKWIDVVKARPSFSAVIPSKEENLSFFKSLLERKAAAAAATAGQ